MTILKQKYPIGISDFKEIIYEQYSFVDKTLFIKEIIDESAKVLLLPRPRRFGKTLNMSMLNYFFDCQQDSKILFDGLNITKADTSYLDYQNQHPVIFLSLKDIKFTSFKDSMEALHGLISGLYLQFQAVWDSSTLSASELKIIEMFISQNASSVELSRCLYHLTEILHRIYNKKVIVLIDEYDTPIISAFSKDYYQDMMSFMRTFLGKSLKDNIHLYKSVLTGILRVAKESVFSDLNNVDVYTLLSEKYNSYFGFTETEVQKLVKKHPKVSELAPIKDWYNGYHIGSELIYNPWSIIKCLKEDGELMPYWINTSDNQLIRDLLKDANINVKADFELLMQGKTITKQIETQISFIDLHNNSTLVLWSFLTLCGYLTYEKTWIERGRTYCNLKIPNNEVRYYYEQFIESWFIKRDPDNYQKFLENLVTGNIEDFSYRLSHYLSESPSFHDFNDSTPEQIYHSFVLGMVVGLNQTHTIKSNRESGFGRYDIMIIPHDKTKLGIIIEFKTVKQAKEEDLELALEKTAKLALEQINSKNYAAELNQMGIKNHLKLGIAFATKSIHIVSE